MQNVTKGYSFGNQKYHQVTPESQNQLGEKTDIVIWNENRFVWQFIQVVQWPYENTTCDVWTFNACSDM